MRKYSTYSEPSMCANGPSPFAHCGLPYNRVTNFARIGFLGSLYVVSHLSSLVSPSKAESLSGYEKTARASQIKLAV